MNSSRRGETDEYETDITDKKELQIRDAMGDILKQLPLDLSKKEDAFSNIHSTHQDVVPAPLNYEYHFQHNEAYPPA